LPPEEYIELRFGPSWKYISLSREFIQEFINISLEDKTTSDEVSMAVTELLENAVKYSVDSMAHIILKINSEKNIKVTVINKGSSEHTQRLQEIFRRVNEGNALDNFVREMKQVAQNNDTSSHLGLARIRYETGAKLDLNIDKNGTVSITCHFSMKGESV